MMSMALNTLSARLDHQFVSNTILCSTEAEFRSQKFRVRLVEALAIVVFVLIDIFAWLFD